MIAMRSVSSSFVDSVGHDPETGTLRVQFRKGGAYDYEGVSVEEFERLLASESIGRAIRFVIGAHPGKRVEE